MRNEITTSSHKIFFLDIGIIKDIPFTQDETLNKAKEALEAAKKYTGSKKFPLLVDVRQQKSISREARHFYSSKEVTDNVTALAFLVESTTSKVLANFFLGLNKPPYPTKLFTNEDEAIEWLKGFLK
ncbi:MAG: STAS/SEC14 domain-containing protein [Ignavibacteriales bacterium]|nr:STAS/SEC14 domain-containing protein [Ignavibacteriales bacterium]